MYDICCKVAKQMGVGVTYKIKFVEGVNQT